MRASSATGQAFSRSQNLSIHVVVLRVRKEDSPALGSPDILKMAHDKGSRPFVLGEDVRCVDVVEEELEIEELFLLFVIVA